MSPSCRRCGRALKNLKAQEAGIGRVCAKREKEAEREARVQEVQEVAQNERASA